jgi:5'-phosphate synthase pdxT subunit
MISRASIGVLALQGDFERHLYQLERCGVAGIEVRRTNDLNNLDGLIIPGGESTTISELLDRFEMRDYLRQFQTEKSVWGTCAGMILMASEVDDPRVDPLSTIDISVKRNGYGRQINSFFTRIPVTLNGHSASLKASFIRAPLVTRYGKDIEVLAVYKDHPVLLRSEKCLVSSFHTELEDDLTLTKYFLDNVVNI